MGFLLKRPLLRLLSWAIILVPALVQSVNAQGPVNTQGPNGQYNIGIIVSSDHDGCYIPWGVRAIRQFTTERAKEINATGGINGHKLHLKFMDELDNVKNTRRLINEAVNDDNMIAMIGLNSSTRGAEVVEQIGRSGIPFISGISRNDLYAPYANIYGLYPSIDDGSEVIKKFKETAKFSKPVFIGQKGNLYVERIWESLKNPQSKKPIVQSHWLEIAPDYTIASMDAADKIIDRILAAGADFLFLAIHSGPTSQFLKRLQARKVSLPVFIMLGNARRIQSIMGGRPYQANMFMRIFGNVPNVENGRLRERISQTGNRNWKFNPAASPFPPARCKSMGTLLPLTSVSDPRNLRAISTGVRYRDMLSLIAELAQSSNYGGDNDGGQTVRKRITAGLINYTNGKKIYRGWLRDWFFTRNRAVAESAFIGKLTPGATVRVLDNTQYLWSANGVTPVPVVFLSVDMTRIFNVDSKQQSFHAEFFLSIKNEGGIDIKDIGFTNLFRTAFGEDNLLNIRPLNAVDGTGSSVQDHKVYKVTGKFAFKADLRRYPFDRQIFSISIQPAKLSRQFIIQPPTAPLFQAGIESDIWNVREQYIGSNQKFLTVIGKQGAGQQIVPYYEYNFTSIMERFPNSYYVRALLPLIAILFTAYLTVFVPAMRLDIVAGIQVTALLSLIAHYGSVSRNNFDQSTLSDVIFTCSYAAITFLLAVSVIRYYFATHEFKRANSAFKYFQMLTTPLFFIAVMYFVLNDQSILVPLQKLMATLGV